MKKTFKDLMVIADRLAAGQNRLKNTILKEVLHTDILMALHKSELGKSLVFQGGTALRLCYGNQRYSEYLDFVRNAPLDLSSFEKFKQVLKASIAKRYELNVRITNPKRPLGERTTDTSIAVHRWVATIEIEKPGVRNQKIHIEVADIPAYDARPRMINSPYTQFGAGPVMLNVSSEKEILADKVIAMAGRDYIKARDIWDIKWLRDKGVELNHSWVHQKAADYHLVDGADISPLIHKLKKRTHDLALPDTHTKFVDEMSRFLAMEQANLWLADDDISTEILMDVSDFLEDQLPKLESSFSVVQNTDSNSRARKIKEWQERMRQAPEPDDSSDPKI